MYVGSNPTSTSNINKMTGGEIFNIVLGVVSAFCIGLGIIFLIINLCINNIDKDQ